MAFTLVVTNFKKVKILGKKKTSRESVLYVVLFIAGWTEAAVVIVLKFDQNMCHSLFHRTFLDISDETLNNFICFSFFGSLGKNRGKKRSTRKQKNSWRLVSRIFWIQKNLFIFTLLSSNSYLTFVYVGPASNNFPNWLLNNSMIPIPSLFIQFDHVSGSHNRKIHIIILQLILL